MPAFVLWLELSASSLNAGITALIDFKTNVQVVRETTEAEVTQELIAEIVAFDSKEKEQVNNEDKDEEDKEPALTTADIRKMFEIIRAWAQAVCDVTNFRTTTEQVKEHLWKTFSSWQATLDQKLLCKPFLCLHCCTSMFIYI